MTMDEGLITASFLPRRDKESKEKASLRHARNSVFPIEAILRRPGPATRRTTERVPRESKVQQQPRTVLLSRVHGVALAATSNENRVVCVPLKIPPVRHSAAVESLPFPSLRRTTLMPSSGLVMSSGLPARGAFGCRSTVEPREHRRAATCFCAKFCCIVCQHRVFRDSRAFWRTSRDKSCGDCKCWGIVFGLLPIHVHHLPRALLQVPKK